MIREKYNPDIDSVLRDVLSKTATSLKTANSIEFTEELVESKAIKKIAFDVYRVENDPYHSLWMLEDIDGKPYLVRASEPSYNSNQQGNWSAISDYEHRNVTLAYKNIPIARFSSDEYEFKPDDIGSFKTALLELVGEDERFVKDVLAEQPEDKVKALVTTFPELSKFI
nr:hypothetical protein 38 [bacterium]